jgi:hypothetical protein
LHFSALFAELAIPLEKIVPKFEHAIVPIKSRKFSLINSIGIIFFGKVSFCPARGEGEETLFVPGARMTYSPKLIFFISRISLDEQIKLELMISPG